MAKAKYESRVQAAVTKFQTNLGEAAEEEKRAVEKEEVPAAKPKVERKKPAPVRKSSLQEDRIREEEFVDILRGVRKREVRNVRICYLLTPTARDNIERVANEHGLSKNSLVNYIFEHIDEVIEKLSE